MGIGMWWVDEAWEQYCEEGEKEYWEHRRREEEEVSTQGILDNAIRESENRNPCSEIFLSEAAFRPNQKPRDRVNWKKEGF